MSNTVVGNVYEAIIEEVVASSKIDFDESGVDDSVLNDLKEGWKKKLSQLDIATFKWDPEPVAPPTTVTGNHGQTEAATTYTQAQLSPTLDSHLNLPNMAPVTAPPPVKTEPARVQAEPVVKQEPDLHNGPGVTDFASNANGVAMSRAIQQMRQNFGDKAEPAINSYKQSTGQTGVMPGQANAASIAQYRNSMQMQQQRMQQQAAMNGTSGLSDAQVDGSTDSVDGVLLHRDVDGHVAELGRVEIDKMLHEQIAARAKRMEGGGLMLPLRQATKHRSIARKSTTPGGISQVDGGPEDEMIKEEIADDEAINSDLDDPEDGLGEDEDDDENGSTMLCLYDKVQRVKNKWKCTLKDGVLNVNGREYLFHKATGEYEW